MLAKQWDQQHLRDIAEYILLGQVEDAEFLTVCEIMDDQLNEDPRYINMSDKEQHELALIIDNIYRKAKVTITFED